MEIFLIFVFHTLISVIDFAKYLLFGYVIMGWLVFFGVIKNPNGILLKIYVFLMSKIEPLLSYIRRFVPIFNGIDFFSILIVFFALHLLKSLIIQILVNIVGG